MKNAMGGGRRWTREEIALLKEMIEKGMNADDIVKSGKLPGRAYEAIKIQIRRHGFVTQNGKTDVTQIRPVDVIGLEEVLKRFTDAFRNICDVKELSKLELDRFRIIFSAAKDYAPLLTQYERLKTVEEEIADLKRIVEEVKTQVTGAADPDKRGHPQDTFADQPRHQQAEPS